MIYRCPKNMLNGPCGGGSGGVCEVSKDLRCPWFNREPSENVELDQGFLIVEHRPGRRPIDTSYMKKLEKGNALSYEYVVRPRELMESVLEKNIEVLSNVFDLLSFVDSPFGHPTPSPLSIASKAVGKVDVMVQMSCKDRNRTALISDIIGAAVIGVKHLLLTTGDWPRLAGDLSVKPVFDLDSVRLIYLASLLSDLGVDHRGRKLCHPLRVHIFAAINPFYDPPIYEIKKMKKKISAGAEAFFTQPIVDLEKFELFLYEARREGLNIPIVASIAIFRSKNDVKLVEEYLRTRISNDLLFLTNSLNIDRFVKTIDRIRSLEMVKGIHVLAFGNHDIASILGQEIRRIIS